MKKLSSIHLGEKAKIALMAVGFLGFREEAVDVRLLGHIGLHGDGLAAFSGDFSDDLVRTFLAGGIVHDDGSACVRQMFGDGSADAFGCAGDNGHLARKFLGVSTHDDFSLDV